MNNNNSNNYWLEAFAGFRKGAVLNEIVRGEDPFVRDLQWLSPLHSEDYKLYRMFDVPGVNKPENYPFEDDGPFWHAVCRDDVSRKFLFVHKASDPADFRGDGGDLSGEIKQSMQKVFSMLGLDGDIESWYHEYYPVARDLTMVALTGDGLNGGLEPGYRAELLLFNIIDDYLDTATSKEEWHAFFKTMTDRMFGKRGIPFMVFTIDFPV